MCTRYEMGVFTHSLLSNPLPESQTPFSMFVVHLNQPCGCGGRALWRQESCCVLHLFTVRAVREDVQKRVVPPSVPILSTSISKTCYILTKRLQSTCCWVAPSDAIDVCTVHDGLCETGGRPIGSYPICFKHLKHFQYFSGETTTSQLDAVAALGGAKWCDCCLHSARCEFRESGAKLRYCGILKLCQTREAGVATYSLLHCALRASHLLSIYSDKTANQLLWGGGSLHGTQYETCETCVAPSRYYLYLVHFEASGMLSIC